MELFYCKDWDGSSVVRLNEEESGHCSRVLRHRVGDRINVIDGRGTLLGCRITDDSPKSVEACVEEIRENFGTHPYILEMAVCPTKNIDRYEWFVEKATELGTDLFVPVIGDHSERKVVKTDRLERITVSAAKQSLKGAVPSVAEPCPVKDYIRKSDAGLKLIAYCCDEEERRRSIMQELSELRFSESDKASVAILVGPEGDFSREEVELAFSCGWKPVHLGPSRLRTETAALMSATAVYVAGTLCA